LGIPFINSIMKQRYSFKLYQFYPKKTLIVKIRGFQNQQTI
jgi:hypothetical protein